MCVVRVVHDYPRYLGYSEQPLRGQRICAFRETLLRDQRAPEQQQRSADKLSGKAYGRALARVMCACLWVCVFPLNTQNTAAAEAAAAAAETK